MNKITIHGNLVSDIELGANEKGSYAHFTVASDRGRSENAGTDFFRCAAFGDWANAENLGDLRKGTFVKVTGSVKLGEYEGKQTVQVVARKIERVAKQEASQ